MLLVGLPFVVLRKIAMDHEGLGHGPSSVGHVPPRG